MEWLAISLVTSAVLTLLLDVALRVFPSMGDHITRAVTDLMSRTSASGTSNERRVRVFVPWKAMIVGSLILTVVVNLIHWLR